MVFMIIAASSTFSMILAYTGVSKGLLGLIEGLQLYPILIFLGMQPIIAFLGCFMDGVSIHDDLPAHIYAHFKCAGVSSHLVWSAVSD